VAAQNAAGAVRGAIKLLLVLLGTQEEASQVEWNKYDRLIAYYAESRNLPAPLVKAVIALESEGLEVNANRAFRYEPGVDFRTIQGNTYFPQYRLPDHPAPMVPYKKGIGWINLPPQITIGEMITQYPYEKVTSYWSPSEVDYTLTAQYRLASSYGLGQIIYRNHYCYIEHPGYSGFCYKEPPAWSKPEPPPEERLYEPNYNIRTMVSHLNVLRNRCTPWLGKDDLDIDEWAPTVKAYNGGVGKCGENAWRDYFPSIKYHFDHTKKPVLASQDFDVSQILSPTLQAIEGAANIGATTDVSGPSEYEIDQLVADVKGTGQRQLVTLSYQVITPTLGVGVGLLKVFNDEAGSAVEWESPPMEGVLPIGAVFTSTVPEGNPPILVAYWGIGAHGAVLYPCRWDGQTFRPIEAVGPDEQRMFGFFGDDGVNIVEGKVQVGNRDGEQPLSISHVATYEWEATTQTFEWAGEEMISDTAYPLYLPLILRNRGIEQIYLPLILKSY